MGEDQTARFFYVPPDDLLADPVSFPPEETHHLKDVIRLGRGVLVTAVDGEGNGAVVRLRRRGESVVGDVERRFRSSVEPERRVTVAFAVLKGQASDLLIEGCTELGAAAFLPFYSARSVPRPVRGRGDRRLRRWERIAKSAMKVARAARAPEVGGLLDWEELLRSFEKHDAVFLCRREGEAFSPQAAGGNLLLLVGPEGGLTEREEEEALSRGARPLSLGPRNLKTATAALAACAALLVPRGTGR